MEELYKYLIAAGLGIVFCVVLLFGGWEAHKWYTGYQDNKLNEVKVAVQSTQNEIVNSIAKGFEDQKQSMDDNSTDIQNRLKKVTVKNVYQNVCIDQDGVDVLVSYKNKSTQLRGFADDKK